MNTPTFPKHDPATADFWDVRYREQFSPWDAGGVPASLKRWAAAEPAPRSVLIPGCGSAWEVEFFAALGWPVLAIDFSPAAVEAARRTLGPLADKVVQADFFGGTFTPASFDLIYERAFLCALPRRLWSDWAARCHALLKPTGRLVGFFYDDDSERGPPFGLRAGELADLMRDRFTLESASTPTDSIEVFRGKETWRVWRRIDR
ncbi:MAG: methyltransferase domain-containing protein [Betaproteobacteria bacterium]|nr:methyltransferase domain-containing protein [Betaproteobacteria bacterium]